MGLILILMMMGVMFSQAHGWVMCVYLRTMLWLIGSDVCSLVTTTIRDLSDLLTIEISDQVTKIFTRWNARRVSWSLSMCELHNAQSDLNIKCWVAALWCVSIEKNCDTVFQLACISHLPHTPFDPPAPPPLPPRNTPLPSYLLSLSSAPSATVDQ